MPINSASVGEMIHAIRKIKGLTQEDLAREVGLSRGQVANIEVGRSDMPLRTLARFAEALGVQMKELIPG